MEYLGQPMANIINESFSSGVFPDALKTLTILPIQKKVGSNLIADHRPINLLPAMEKLIEQLAYDQFKHFIDSNQILGQNQSGFRAKHSCESAINDVLFEWREAQNKSKIIIGVFLD